MTLQPFQLAVRCSIERDYKLDGAAADLALRGSRKFPKMSSDRYEDNAMRKNDVIFAFRGLQVIFVISILGVAGNDASTWSDIECSIPAKLAYNIAAVSDAAGRN